ncbi:HNH endonuclease family protein [Pseudomonas oryzihabitans]|uniref:hypothetical protein n=1 Tax=Pseudomonas oryzihabitans TaxID=47885 RepID=UPI0011A0221D|nr:hypothetical protein [Pseudomonas oryzihabitans]
MIKFDSCAFVDPDTITSLEKYPIDDRSKRWDGKAKAVIRFKNEIMTQGLTIQNKKCAWCTLSIAAEGRRTAHRDHIAPKARHPKWTFNPNNLIIACEYCNGFAVKGGIDTIHKLNDAYEECIFLIVHPYLDEPSDHLEFTYCNTRELPVLIKGKTPKGIWTIENLQLDSTGLTTERAKDIVWEKQLSELPPNAQALLKAATASLG